MEVLRDIRGDLPGDPPDLGELVLGRPPEVLERVEARVPEGLRLRGADPLDLEEFAEELALLCTGLLEGDDLPLRVLVVCGELEGLAVRLLRVVIPAHLSEDVPLGDPRVGVPRVQLEELVVRLEFVLQVAPLLRDAPLVEEGPAVAGVAGDDRVQRREGLVHTSRPAEGDALSHEGGRFLRFYLQDVVANGGPMVECPRIYRG